MSTNLQKSYVKMNKCICCIWMMSYDSSSGLWGNKFNFQICSIIRILDNKWIQISFHSLIRMRIKPIDIVQSAHAISLGGLDYHSIISNPSDSNPSDSIIFPIYSNLLEKCQNVSNPPGPTNIQNKCQRYETNSENESV